MNNPSQPGQDTPKEYKFQVGTIYKISGDDEPKRKRTEFTLNTTWATAQFLAQVMATSPKVEYANFQGEDEAWVTELPDSEQKKEGLRALTT